jgi:hypothetical protein
MSKPGGCHSSGISLGDALRLPKRHPAGSCAERENLVRPKVLMRRRGARPSRPFALTHLGAELASAFEAELKSKLCGRTKCASNPKWVFSF